MSRGVLTQAVAGDGWGAVDMFFDALAESNPGFRVFLGGLVS